MLTMVLIGHSASHTVTLEQARRGCCRNQLDSTTGYKAATPAYKVAGCKKEPRNRPVK
jgi:hypothetical protein